MEGEGGDGRSSPTFQSRYEKSLGLLTTKFVNLLQSSSGGVLDLKKVHSEHVTGYVECLLAHIGTHRHAAPLPTRMMHWGVRRLLTLWR